MTVGKSFDYDKVWNEWDEMTQVGPFHRHIHRIIKNLMHPLSFISVCDVGCGSGSFLKELQMEFPHIQPCGMDVSSVAIELARSKIPRGRFWVTDATKEPLSEKFDIILCCEVLEHILDDQITLENIAQMTEKYLIVTTVQGQMRSWEASKVGHVRNYAYGELNQKIKKAGFEIVNVVEWGFPFYSPLYRDLLALTKGAGTKGKIGKGRKLIADLLYFLFKLNSHHRGDEIIVLAKRII